MLKEGLKNIDNSSVIIGITEEEEIESLDVLLQVSADGFSTSARVLLLEYCEVKFGWTALRDYLISHELPELNWACEFCLQEKEWEDEPDDAAKELTQAICDRNDEAIVKAVKSGGRLMTPEMIFHRLPVANLSVEILMFLFANAMPLKLRCMTLLGTLKAFPKYGKNQMYDRMCNMVTALVNVLINDEGILLEDTTVTPKEITNNSRSQAMANIIAIYCLKAKKDRQDVEKYRELVKLLNRQIAQGGLVWEMKILGLYEAKKTFRCENHDPYGRNFWVTKGEYFLLVKMQDFDANHWRLQRACRSEEERHNAWPLVGEAEDFGFGFCDDDLNDLLGELPELVEPSLKPTDDESEYYRKLPIELPQIITDHTKTEDVSKNYIVAYTISEYTPSMPIEDVGYSVYTEKEFADAPELLPIYRKFIGCHFAEEINQLEKKDALIKYIVKKEGLKYKKTKEIPPHYSLVIGVIDGKTDYWNCGVWCYKRRTKLTVAAVQYFLADGYEWNDKIGLIPKFEHSTVLK